MRKPLLFQKTLSAKALHKTKFQVCSSNEFHARCWLLLMKSNLVEVEAA